MKKWYASKTVWFGTLWVLTGIASAFGFMDYVPSEQVITIASVANGLLIVLLRFLSSKKI